MVFGSVGICSSAQSNRAGLGADENRVVMHGYSVADWDKRIAIAPDSPINITYSRKDKNWVQTTTDVKSGKKLHEYVRGTGATKGYVSSVQQLSWRVGLLRCLRKLDGVQELKSNPVILERLIPSIMSRRSSSWRVQTLDLRGLILSPGLASPRLSARR